MCGFILVVMVLVSPNLVYKYINKDLQLKHSFGLLKNNEKVKSLLKMTNIMAVKRLNYNDHGTTHSNIAVGSALEMLDILLSRKIKTSIVSQKEGDISDSKQVILFGAYLHDIGNSIHRSMHHLTACILASPILDEILPEVYPDIAKRIIIKQEILHTIFSHDESVPSLSIESGIVSVADGTDMAKGRARIPYKGGKRDIHSISALSIESVEILRGNENEPPIQIRVNMTNLAGVFQIDEVLKRKIEASGIKELVKVLAIHEGKEIRGM
jgi:hypothetical protein